MQGLAAVAQGEDGADLRKGEAGALGVAVAAGSAGRGRQQAGLLVEAMALAISPLAAARSPLRMPQATS